VRDLRESTDNRESLREFLEFLDPIFRLIPFVLSCVVRDDFSSSETSYRSLKSVVAVMMLSLLRFHICVEGTEGTEDEVSELVSSMYSGAA
jgi:hypothetical protein